MKNKTEQHRILLIGSIRINNPQYFEFEGELTYDTDISEGGDDCQYYPPCYMCPSESNVEQICFDKLGGKFPYLVFDSRGVIPQTAISI